VATLLDLGDVYDAASGCEIYIYDDAGDLAAATVALTITLPDGTTTTPAVTTPSTGRYQSSYKPTQAGTHYVQWVATSVGGVSGEDTAHEDSFTVSESTNTFVSLAEAKSLLNMQDTADDDELLSYLEWACDLAEQIADTKFGRKTYTSETYSTNGSQHAVVLNHKPVISITTVTENGATLSASDYRVDSNGLLYRRSGYVDYPWSESSGGITVTYVAGHAIIPTPVRNATLQILDHLWSTQRNRAGGRPSREDYPASGANWNVPHKARDVLLDYRTHRFV
jgi:hypothetical protein